MIMKFYKIVTLLAAPLIKLYLLKRKMAGKEDPKRFYERLGRPSFPRPEGRVIWVHAASVGESLSVLPLVERLTEQFPEANVLFTTGTTTSAKLIETRLPGNAFHQYIPVDSILAVKRFLKHWKPELALWVESEFWPNLLNETAKVCPLVLVNARISDKSFARWKKYPNICAALLNNFSLCLPQSNQDAERLVALGAQHVKYIGNLKYDASTLPADSKKMSALLAMIEDRHLWIASSTHPGEEEMVAETHLAIKKSYPDLLTIIIPRHPQRGKDIATQLVAKKCNVALRSAEEPIQPDTDIYLADTIGELGIFYRLANIVFIGGSLVKHGGQNPLEAARLHCAVIAGQHMENFRDVMQELEEKQACIRVNNVATLIAAVEGLIQDIDRQDAMAGAALAVVQAKGEILDNYITELRSFIEPLASSASQQHVA